jgi:hypothetical protein
MNLIKAHAYGGGRQSVAILWKYLNDEMGRPDVVVCADTQSEPASFYETVNRDRKECDKRGVDFRIVSYGNLTTQNRGIFIPAYTINKNGHKGTLMRQCTDRFKIQPIRQELRKMGATKAEMWLGISTDEASRMKDSTVKWIVNKYPLIEANMSVADCQCYLEKIGVSAHKTACTFCPYRSAKNWKILTTEEQLEAIRYDERLRKRMRGVNLYVHSSRVPLRDALEIINGTEINLFNQECEGYCGI